MTRIPLSKKILPDKYWLVYLNENGDRKHIDLSGCAGSFARNTGAVSEDGLRAVGWRYEEQGQVCYELFNVGHTVVFAPRKPGLVQTLGYMLSNFGQYGFYLVMMISIINTVEYNEYKHGTREEAIIASIRPFFTKMGSALVVVIKIGRAHV